MLKVKRYAGLNCNDSEVKIKNLTITQPKTQELVNKIDSILSIDPTIPILWFSMEDPGEKIMASMIARRARLTIRQMRSIGYTLTEEEAKRIIAATESIKSYKIEFIDTKMDIYSIKRRAKLFKKKHDRPFMIVIDNLGLIDINNFKGIDTQKDDIIANELVKMRLETKASIILIHHFTKANIQKINLKDGYRPREENLRGSSRILDYANQVAFVNRPNRYPDLIEEELEANKTLEFSTNFSEYVFKNELWRLNDQGDKETEWKKEDDLYQKTYDALYSKLGVESTLEGERLTYQYFANKYYAYSKSIDDVNRERAAGMKSRKDAILTFINQKKYNSTYGNKNVDSREYYLYGDIPFNQRKELIKTLFIMEIVKNRDGNDLDERLIRYKCDLNYNEFIPL